MFIKAEFYFFVGFLLLYGLVNVHFEVPEFPLIVCLVLLELVLIAVTRYSFKNENRTGALITVVSFI